MKFKKIQFKFITIETCCRRIDNGFVFTPLSIFNVNISNYKYLCIIIDLIKINISINFIWKKTRDKNI